MNNSFFIENGELKSGFKWIRDVSPDPDVIKLYALQFANCIRIIENNTVFLLDEVGCGKTISAGIMAMVCLERSDKGKVLIISTPAQAGSSTQRFSPFLDDWNREKKTITEEGLEIRIPEGKFRRIIARNKWQDRIEVINYDERNITKFINEKSERYALIIIDEAQYFLNDSKRCESLKKLKAEKIIFATATPVKYDRANADRRDLQIYCDIAKEVLQDKYEQDTLAELEGALTPKEDETGYPLLCCNTFDPHSRVSRYFKDTMRAFCAGEEKQSSPEREASSLWILNDHQKGEPDKRSFLAQKISEVLKNTDGKGNPNRVIVFANRVNNENEDANISTVKDICLSISKYLEQNNPGRECRYATGDNSSDLINYTGKQISVPDVLVLSGPIAEAGVNFPMYNYIVNYSIPRFPANIEQRFGRVDRLKSDHDKIHNCFCAVLFDNDYMRYMDAVSQFENDVLSKIPSRNAVFDKTAIDYYNSQIDIIPEEKKNNRSYERFDRYDLIDPDMIFYKTASDEIRNISTASCAEDIAKDPVYAEFEKQFNKAIEIPLKIRRICNEAFDLFGKEINLYISRLFMKGEVSMTIPAAGDVEGFGKLLRDVLSDDGFISSFAPDSKGNVIEFINDEDRGGFLIRNCTMYFLARLPFYSEFYVPTLDHMQEVSIVKASGFDGLNLYRMDSHPRERFDFDPLIYLWKRTSDQLKEFFENNKEFTNWFDEEFTASVNSKDHIDLYTDGNNGPSSFLKQLFCLRLKFGDADLFKNLFVSWSGNRPRSWVSQYEINKDKKEILIPWMDIYRKTIVSEK